LRELWVARHGETDWTVSKRHTSRTDLDLTPRGVAQAEALGARLRDGTFSFALTSPALRARRTLEIAALPGDARVDDDLREFEYGDYEGSTTAQIKETRPGWDLWRDGCPGGEQTSEVAGRADNVLARVSAMNETVLVVTHGHFGRVLAARYLELEGTAGALFVFGTAALSILGTEHERPAMLLWNDTSHLRNL
jgi:probable phosphoglycerate mutase